tara:strand:+ start:67 stop:753 length:687 start_codon:yes stop_codon:yes gene_type:complete
MTNKAKVEYDDRLIQAINEIANLPDKDKIQIKGKFYTTVDKRLQTFRKHLGTNARIITKIIHHDLERVVVEASVSICVNDQWSVIGTDHAEEFRADGYINKTSALENCCTSSIGRALASCGLGGGEYASAFEMDNAINSKASAPVESKAESKPKAEPKTEPEEHDEGWANSIIEALKIAIASNETKDGLNSVFKGNKPYIDVIEEKHPAKYKELLGLFTVKKEEIQNG